MVGLIDRVDRQFIRRLVAENWDGRSAIVDAGSLLGASACSLADGVLASKHPEVLGVVHCYDRFEVQDSYLRNFFRDLAAPLEIGEDLWDYGWSFRDLFDVQTFAWRHLLTVHSGDIEEQEVPDEIGLFFLDIYSQPRTTSALLRRFLPRLLPGALLIHKEFGRSWHPWPPVVMHLLREYFEPAGAQGYFTRAFRLTRPLTEAEIILADPSRISTAEQEQVLIGLAGRAGRAERAQLEACRARLLQEAGEVSACVELVDTLLEQHPLHPCAGDLRAFRQLALEP